MLPAPPTGVPTWTDIDCAVPPEAPVVNFVALMKPMSPESVEPPIAVLPSVSVVPDGGGGVGVGVGGGGVGVGVGVGGGGVGVGVGGGGVGVGVGVGGGGGGVVPPPETFGIPFDRSGYGYVNGV